VPRPTPQGEALAAWALLAADALAVLVVYSVVDPAELRSVSRDGLAGGLSRALVQLNYPIALVAIPLALLALDTLSRRAWLVGAPALALCAVVAVPGVLDPDDLDAKAVNVLPAIGAVLVLCLTIAATREAGAALAPARRGDRVRVAAGVLVLLVSLPWIAAEVGFHFPQGVFLTTELYTEPGEAATAAVHLGHHHGFTGTLFVISALLLSRPRLRAARLRRAYALLLSLMLVYGAEILANDLWHEQVVKRGWTDWDVPSALEPRPNVIWVLVLACAAVVYRVGFARRGAPQTGDNQLP
jgi:hypothetical protein